MSSSPTSLFGGTTCRAVRVPDAVWARTANSTAQAHSLTATSATPVAVERGITTMFGDEVDAVPPSEKLSARCPFAGGRSV
jgi:hypothetical protein